ncbi:MAG: GNAT family N-acetyltransferase [Candidatus Heimdallarchaeaceae archaeon]|jgi:GNAT superfamily N-acetyltransferase
MSEEYFLDTAENNLGLFCLMVWDFYKLPQFFTLDVINDSIRCSYGSNSLIFGKPNFSILERIHDKGDIYLSFKQEWLQHIKERFTDFSLILPDFHNNLYNTFLAMKLKQGNFIPKVDHISKKITKAETGFLNYKRQAHLSSDVGGIGIIHNENLIGCAFAPHIIQNDRFSFGVVRDVWVHPNFRGQGFGYDLSSKICEELFDIEIDEIYLWVEKHNFPAVHIYKKLGFIINEEFYSILCKKKKNN